MGVTGLWKLIESSGKPVPLETLENKVLAIDISIWLHQVVKGFQDSKGGTLPNAHLLGLFHRLCKLLYYRIKPVFVFDGGVPSLKLETISKRSQTKNKYQSEAERLEHLILTSLAKEKVVQQALGGTTKSLLSPLKGKARTNEKSEDDIFKLPTISEEVLSNLDKSIASSTDLDSSTSLDDSNSSLSRYAYSINLNQIDVTSSHFKNLPPDVRYEILSDIKETRKQSSWGRLHELPAESNDFSSFQMKRLLKRRKVQQSIEETEKEMGGKCLSLGELESLLTEDGIVTASSKHATKQIASDENTRFLLVKDMKKAMEKAAEEAKKKEDEVKAGPSNIKNEIKNENGVDDENDYDLQLAIQLSLTDDTDLLEPNEFEDKGGVKLSDKQKLNLHSAAMKLARGYMMDYGGMSNEEVNALFEKQNEEELNETISEIFKYNDKSIIIGNDSSGVSKLSQDDPLKLEKAEKSPVYVSSDSDSDFVDVPDIDFDEDVNKFPILPIQMNIQKNGDISKDFQLSDLKLKPIEIIIDPTLKKQDDDLFADIFTNKTENEELKELFVNKIEEVKIDENITQSVIEIKSDSIKNSEKLSTENLLPFNKDNVSDILEKLKQEKDNIKNINLDTILIDDVEQDSNDLIETLKKQRDVEATKKSFDEIVINQSGLRTPILIIEDNVEISNSEIKSLVVAPPKTPIKHSEIIEISDDAEIVKRTVDAYYSPSGKSKTPTKVIIEAIDDVENKITKPFFVNRTPKSKTPTSKSPGSSNKDGELHKSAVKRKVSKSLFQNDVVEEPKKTKPMDTEDLLKEVSSALKESKSKDELISIANDLRKEKRELEVERNKQDRLGISITDKMNRECMNLLTLFGIPYIVAPMEAEAQCAFLNQCKLTDGTITDDSDIWLFGGDTVYKNFFNQKKHVMEFRVEDIEKLYKVDRKKMIQLALLVGSDYTFGINGVGAVTALEILASFPSTPMKTGETTEQMSMMSGLRKFREWWMNGRPVGPGKTALRGKLKNIDLTEGFPSYQVMEAYLYPKIDDNREPFKWGTPDPTEIRDYARLNFGWTSIKTDEIFMPVLKKMNEKKSQQSIRNYFNVQNAMINRELKLSKRVQGAINKLSGKIEQNDETSKNQKRIKKLKKTMAKEKSSGIIEIEDEHKDNLSNKNIPSTSKAKTKAIKKVNKK